MRVWLHCVQCMVWLSPPSKESAALEPNCTLSRLILLIFHSTNKWMDGWMYGLTATETEMSTPTAPTLWHGALYLFIGYLVICGPGGGWTDYDICVGTRHLLDSSRSRRRKLEKPFADADEVERRYSKFVEGSRPESLLGWHVSDAGEVWRQIRRCAAVQQHTTSNSCNHRRSAQTKEALSTPHCLSLLATITRR